MYAYGIVAVGALALSTGFRVDAAALPPSDAMWSRYNTERYFDIIENCHLHQLECLWLL
jgi:hypothetical protein